MFNDKLIEASRDFVCIRLATYEDEDEAEFLRTVYTGRSGDLENTVFVLLSPDTKRDLCRAGRGPQFAFGRPESMAVAMKKIAEEFQPKEREPGSVPPLPQLKNVRLGLNVSSCDGLPSVICVAEDKAQASEMQAKLAPLAFSDELAGKFVYATTVEPKELKPVQGYQGQTGFLLVKPGEFGVDGELMREFAVNTDAETLRTAMVAYANGVARVNKNHASHVRKGVQEGKSWETEIPVTDQGSLKAMERTKNRSSRK